uniref:Uncharacterized protein n=1 Tax=mine drainage metagenome TaxID=410659 RepID=E6PYV9_9ZZZZ
MVAGAIDDLVVGVVLGAEGAEGVFAGPSVEGEVAAGDVGVFEEFSAEIIGGAGEEQRPCAAGGVGRLKGGDFVFGDVELPDDDEHTSNYRIGARREFKEAGRKELR